VKHLAGKTDTIEHGNGDSAEISDIRFPEVIAKWMLCRYCTQILTKAEYPIRFRKNGRLAVDYASLAQ
jgi:hypothetical protein